MRGTGLNGSKGIEPAEGWSKAVSWECHLFLPAGECCNMPPFIQCTACLFVNKATLTKILSASSDLSSKAKHKNLGRAEPQTISLLLINYCSVNTSMVENLRKWGTSPELGLIQDKSQHVKVSWLMRWGWDIRHSVWKGALLEFYLKVKHINDHHSLRFFL